MWSDLTSVPHFKFMEISQDLISTRGDRYKLVQRQCYYDFY